MKIVVLAGGISTERDISIISGTKVCEGLRKKNHQAILLDVFFGKEELPETIFPSEYDIEKETAYIKSFDEQLEEIKKEKRDFFGPHVITICKQADVVFLALHGDNGENGKVQAAFDLMGIRYTGAGSLGSGLAMDKGIAKKIFMYSGIPTPKGISLHRSDNKAGEQLSTSGMRFPVVVKPCCGGSSVGVFIVHDQKEYEDALEQCFLYEEEVIIEQYIQGREFSVAIIEGKAFPVIEIEPLQGFYDYKNKYQTGAAVETCPADLSLELSQKMQKFAENGFRALGLESYARLDFMMNDKEEMFCLEANTLPGMTPTSLLPQEAAVVGMDFPDLCEELIRVSLKKYE